MKKKYKVKVMIKVLWNLLLEVILLTAILVYTPTLAQLSNYNPQGLKAATLEEVLALPDEEFDLATAILILCKGWDASVDVVACLEEIDKMALELEVRIILEDNPKKIVSLINHYLFEKKNYSLAPPSDPDYIKLENSALPWVIENKKGDCLGLSLLYLALAERLRLPFYGIAVPDHVFVRYDDRKKKINIETTGKGCEYEDSYYKKEFMLHPTYKNYNFYLRNLSKREVMGLFFNDLGVAYDRKGMYDEAIIEFKRAIEINPNNVEAHCNLGVAYHEKGMYDEAIAELKKAIEINPNYAKAHYNLGLAYGRIGMYDEEIAEYKEAIEINPNCAEAHCNLGVAYILKRLLDKAITELKKAIKIDPNLVEAYNDLAIAYYYKEEYSLAIKYCDRAIELGYRVHPEFLKVLQPYR